MLEFTVRRRKWIRGEACDIYLLREEDQMMCCLGFLARKCGISTSMLRNITTPEEVDHTELFPTSIRNRQGYNTITCNKIMDVNDNNEIDDNLREKKLTSLFKKIKIKVQFVD